MKPGVILLGRFCISGSPLSYLLPLWPETEPDRNYTTVGWGGPKDPEKGKHQRLLPVPALWLATASVSPLESLVSVSEDC